MKKLKILFLVLFCAAVVIPLVYAGGGGGSGGSSGGSSGGKSSGGGKSNSGGNTIDPNAQWISVKLDIKWVNANTQLMTCNNGIGYPINPFGTNTYPDVFGSTSPSLSPDKYYGSIKVENTGIQALTVDMKNFAYTGNYMDIEIPQYRTYKITFEYVDGCTKCMLPVQSVTGKRIRYKSINTFTSGFKSPVSYPLYYGLIDCQ